MHGSPMDEIVHLQLSGRPPFSLGLRAVVFREHADLRKSLGDQGTFDLLGDLRRSSGREDEHRAAVDDQGTPVAPGRPQVIARAGSLSQTEQQVNVQPQLVEESSEKQPKPEHAVRRPPTVEQGPSVADTADMPLVEAPQAMDGLRDLAEENEDNKVDLTGPSIVIQKAFRRYKSCQTVSVGYGKIMQLHKRFATVAKSIPSTASPPLPPATRIIRRFRSCTSGSKRRSQR